MNRLNNAGPNEHHDHPTLMWNAYLVSLNQPLNGHLLEELIAKRHWLVFGLDFGEMILDAALAKQRFDLRGSTSFCILREHGFEVVCFAPSPINCLNIHCELSKG